MSSPSPLPSTLRQLDALVATAESGYLVISWPVFTATGNRWLARSFAVDEVDSAAAFAAHLDQQMHNVYVRSTLIGRPLQRPTERGNKNDTAVITALAVDLDIAGPGHKQGNGDRPLPPTIVEGMRIVSMLPPPTLTVSTGGGLHLWWLLDEAVTDGVLDLVERWRRGIVEAGQRCGYHVDSPGPDRVLRVCGTHRRKPGIDANLVQITDVTGWPDGNRPWVPTGRYGAEDLVEALPTPRRTAPQAPKPQRPEGEVGPADALQRLSWRQILERFDWTFVGTDTVHGKPVELWSRPGEPTSEYSAKADPDGALMVHSDAAGFPEANGTGYSKAQVVAILSGCTVADLAGLIRRRQLSRRASR